MVNSYLCQSPLRHTNITVMWWYVIQREALLFNISQFINSYDPITEFYHSVGPIFSHNARIYLWSHKPKELEKPVHLQYLIRKWQVTCLLSLISYFMDLQPFPIDLALNQKEGLLVHAIWIQLTSFLVGVIVAHTRSLKFINSTDNCHHPTQSTVTFDLWIF